MSEFAAFHPVVERIVTLLRREHCRFITFVHEPVRTSEEAAMVRPEYSIAQGAKALIVAYRPVEASPSSSRLFAQAVVPGNRKFDTKKLIHALGARDVRFASEAEVIEVTAGVVPGGVPPFGKIFGLRVIVDPTLLANETIIFNAGDRRFSVALNTEDYRRVMAPEIVTIVSEPL